MGKKKGLNILITMYVYIRLDEIVRAQSHNGGGNQRRSFKIKIEK